MLIIPGESKSYYPKGNRSNDEAVCAYAGFFTISLKKQHLLLFLLRPKCSDQNGPSKTLTSCSCVNVITADIITFTLHTCIAWLLVTLAKANMIAVPVLRCFGLTGDRFIAHCQRAKRVGMATDE